MMMPIKAQQLMLRVWSVEELGRLFPMCGEWDSKSQQYQGCCNVKPADLVWMCTLAPQHPGPHIAHQSSGLAKYAWVNEGS
jgi:hypothetical protein